MDQNIATAEKEVLEELVKLVQRKGLRGENGGWNEFVDVYNKSIKSPNDDPSSSNDMNVAFLSTFKKKIDLKFLHYHANSLLVANFKKESPENDTPEQRLVRLTMKHPEYSLDYSFQSLFREDWFISDVGMKMLEVMKSTDMIAVDCEMVLCEDGTEGLVRVGAVDRDLKVILHEFVKPDKRVVDYRTPVTGVTAEDIEKATLSVVDIQKVLQPFLSKGAILVGHSLNKDMKVLKIDHPKVIDTALAFKLSNARQSRKPSLNDLYMAIFGEEVRKLGIAHNCVHDAAATMKIALAFVEKRVDDTTITPSKELLEAVNSKFFLHRIPHNVTSEVLENVLARAFGSTEFKLEVKPAKSPGGYYCAIVVFDNSRKAEQAFENIAGYQDKDSSGLPQKRIVFQKSSGLSDNFYIRKMG